MAFAHPAATLLSTAMMIEYAFKLMNKGYMIRKAVFASLEAEVITMNISVEKSYSPLEVNDWIANYVALY